MRQRVVVVGAGMVGARFADELVRADAGCDAGSGLGRFDVLLLGAETYQPYNRVLLSDVVAGRADVASLTLPLSERVDLHCGTPVTAIDRARRRVRGRGVWHGYDHLVLATGARAHVPAMAGLPEPTGRRPAGVHVLRTVDDGRDLLAASTNAEAVVVVGGGLLGVEAACGLRARGLDVTLVHHRDRLLDRQLSGPAAGVVLAAVADLGIRVWLGARPAEVRTRFGRVHELLLADGRCVPADLVLLACGARPDTALARAAGLGTSHGVLVGDDLTSPDDARVHAIGDCAQPPQGCSGLVAPGWSQARRLARRLAGADPEAGSAGGSAGRSGPGPVVRLKAVGLDVLTLGDPPGAGDPPGRRTVTLHDPQGHRHVDVSVRDGRVVAATCVGAGDVAADLTVAFDRQTPTPPDPAAMLLGSSLAGGAPAGSPTAMPAGATVCRCNGVTKADVVAAWEGGAAQVDDVAARTRAGTGCGGCRGVIQGLLDWLDQAEPDRTRPDRTRPDRTREPAVPTRLT